MGKLTKGPSGKIRIVCGLATILTILAGCAKAPEVRSSTGFNDPYETENRAVHQFNKGVDRAILRPLTQIGGSGGSGVLRPVRRGVTNLGDTLETPGRIVNNLLQGRIENAGHNGFRLAINLLIGVGGIFDPSTSIGLEARDTDFGETLHVCGAKEGPYLELPLLGPSTMRDTVGDVVDMALNPLGHLLPPEAMPKVRAVRLGAKLAQRSRYGSTVDEVLHNSADSYAQTRLIYLQNRRFELKRNGRKSGDEIGSDVDIDPYADPYGQDVTPEPYADATETKYIDPYEELYGP